MAVKIIPCDSQDEVSTITAEIDFLKRLTSPYIVAYVDGFLFENELWIIMEYCGGGSIGDILAIQGKPLDESCIRSIVAFAALGLHHLHSLSSIHRDIKSGNILLTNNGKAKLADFGVSVQLTATVQRVMHAFV